MQRLAPRDRRNKVVVAIANNLARIAWAVLSSGKEHRHEPPLQLSSWLNGGRIGFEPTTSTV